MPRGEYQPRYEGPSREERVQEAIQTLEQGIDSILSSDGFADYLRTLARLHQYSFGNVLLIKAQRPDSTRVAGYRTWQSLGRQVKKGERGITILAPIVGRVAQEDADGVIDEVRVVRAFRTAAVFDISQTEGEDLPEPPRPAELAGSTEQGRALYSGLMSFLDEQGVPVVREDTSPAHGYYSPLTRTIGLHHELEGDQAAKTLTHETAHLVADHTLGMDKRDVETVAEAAAFVVLNHAGIDSSEYSFPYIAHWAQDRTVLKRNLDAVQKTAHQIIDALERTGALPSHDDAVPATTAAATHDNQLGATAMRAPQIAVPEAPIPEESPVEPAQHTIWEADSFVDGFEEVRLSDAQLSAVERDLARKGIKGHFIRRGDDA